MSMLEKLVLPEIRELINSKDLSTLREILGEWLAPDLAALVEDLEPDEQALVFRSLERPKAAETFAYLGFSVQERLVESLPIGEVAKILAGMAPDDRTRLLERLPADRKQLDANDNGLSLLAEAHDRLSQRVSLGGAFRFAGQIQKVDAAFQGAKHVVTRQRRLSSRRQAEPARLLAEVGRVAR